MSPRARAPVTASRYAAIWRAWSARDLVRVPTLLSLSRLLFAGAFPFVLGRSPWPLVIVLTAGLTDLADGWYARRFGQETATGAAVDAVADKVFVVTVIVTLLAAGQLSWLGLLFLGVRDLGELALMARLWAVGSRPLHALESANAAGKVATFLQYAAVLALLLGVGRPLLWTGAAAVGGAVAAVTYWRRALRSRPPRSPA